MKQFEKLSDLMDFLATQLDGKAPDFTVSMLKDRSRLDSPVRAACLDAWYGICAGATRADEAFYVQELVFHLSQDQDLAVEVGDLYYETVE